MASYFRHPVNGYQTKATGSFSGLWAVLLGPFWMA
jgi:hypothetical protein